MLMKKSKIYSQLELKKIKPGDKVRILKERTLLIGKTLIDEKEKNSREIREMKKEIIQLKSEMERKNEIIERITEHLSNTPKREELAILQRQLDLLRK